MAKPETTDGPKGHTTIYDIAKTVGVSASTVSRALSGSRKVGAETRARIVEAAKASNYQVNTVARNFRQRRGRTIEVVFPLAASGQQRMADPFYLDMLAVVADELSAKHFDLLLANTVPWAQSEKPRQTLVDGIILVGQGQDQDALNAFARDYRKVVVWGARVPEQNYVSVGSDNPRGGKMATEHLIRLGRRRIAFIGDPEEPEMQQRRDGYFTALKEAGISVDDKLLFSAPFTAARARIATQAAVASSVAFDAAVCGSDVIALNLIDVLSSVGKRVPEDVSVIGYDDISLASSYGQALTTISQEIAVGGSLLVNRLFSLIDDADVDSAVIPPRLQIRQTCGAYAK